MVVILLCCLAAAAFAQSDEPTFSAAPNSARAALTPTADEATANGGDSSDLLQFVRSYPDVLVGIKRLMLERLREQGSLLDEQGISDRDVYRELESNPEFAGQVVKWLVDQGYASEEEGRSLQTTASATQSGTPSVSQRGREQSTTASGFGTAPRERTATGNREPSSREQMNREQPFDDSTVNPKTVRQTNPYPSLPSTSDLYRQFPDQSASLKRFGSDIFRSDTVGLNSFPMDLPAGPEYVLGPGDTVTVDIWGGVSQRLARPVDREGRISLPDAGPMVVAGMTLAKAQETVQAVLEPQFRNARVALSVTRLRTVRVYVVGDVQRPGAYDISSLSTPLNALYAAGGPAASGSLRVVKHYRGEHLVCEVDLYDLLIHGERKEIAHLEPGDTILVPPVGPLVAVAGMVRRPAVYELKGESQLADVIEMAGGVTVSANLGEVKVERIEAHEKRVMVNVKFTPASLHQSARETVGTFRVQDGDRVWVAPILPYNDKSVYLQGHVYRPGTYPFRDGMKITDLIHSYQEVLPEPANHAEIIRLQPPDFRPQTISIDLGGALSGDETLPLQQFDTVRIFGRYEVDPPKVSVFGEVLRPGAYPMGRGMTAADLVQMAGGFRRGAYTEKANLSTHSVENGDRVLTSDKTINIGAAMTGDAAEDVKLKPGDVLTILQIPGWAEIGQSVTIRGEVTFPGSYGLTEGERLSTLIKLAGGFRPEAYPAGAVLDRAEVRRLEEQGRQELIRRIEAGGATAHFAPTSTGQDQAALLQAMQQQQAQTLSSLRAQPPTGRLVVVISSDIREWENTPADVYLRDGDVITVPKKPNFVLAYGQVHHPSAVTYLPGKTAQWYLGQAGGATETADKKAIYIIRANGSVVSSQGGGGWFKGSVLDTKMRPGDTLVVPEKAVGGNSGWKTTLETAQLIASLGVAAAVATHF
jgi:protein involved in polysaccharide export with SLBB domain